MLFILLNTCLAWSTAFPTAVVVIVAPVMSGIVSEEVSFNTSLTYGSLNALSPLPAVSACSSTLYPPTDPSLLYAIINLNPSAL